MNRGTPGEGTRPTSIPSIHVGRVPSHGGSPLMHILKCIGVHTGRWEMEDRRWEMGGHAALPQEAVRRWVRW
jgi:hypothetical protein